MALRLRERARQRAIAWARRRQGEDALPLELAARRLYILPTRLGLGSGALLFLMLMAGMNYSNSMALAITFLVAAWVLVGMFETQRMLRGLRILQARATDCHAGGEGHLELQLANPAPRGRHALSLRAPGGEPQAFELAPGEERWVQAPFRAGKRGRQKLDRLELSTVAPLGLFRAWTWLYLPLEAIVYPVPRGVRALPRSGAWHQSHAMGTTGRDPAALAGLRPYVDGDSPRSIAWKAWARGGPLMVAQYEGEGGQEHLLEWSALAGLDAEARLEQLAAWVEACAVDGSAFALELPGVRLPLAQGDGQRVAALRALALHGEAGP